MTSATDVARHLLWLASREEDGEGVSNLRLQKLLYYVQGWSLALRGKPAFGERIEAWKHGPVVPDVYQQCTRYGYNPIPPLPDDGKTVTDATERSLIETVWQEYRCYSAEGLRDLTHTERPWVETRSDLGDDANSRRSIKHALLLEFFTSQIITPGGVDPRTVWAAEEAVDRGETMSAEEARAILFSDP